MTFDKNIEQGTSLLSLQPSIVEQTTLIKEMGLCKENNRVLFFKISTSLKVLELTDW